MGHTIDTFIDALKEQIATPKADLEKNIRTLVSEWVTKMDLVSRDELLRQQTALDQANQRLNHLQNELKRLEEKLNSQQ